MKKIRLLKREIAGRYRIIELWISSDWASKAPWKIDGKIMPYFWSAEAEDTTAEVISFGAGPLALMWAYSK